MSIATLHKMLTYKRPHESRAERAFIERFLSPLGVTEDGFGNLIKTVGPSPRVAWSSHTDTVHKSSGSQRIEVTEDGWIYAKGSDCLGADCTAGVWLMAEMIQRNVPGLYLFHRAEESGGRGSSWIARNTPELFDNVDSVIAFDRKGFNSVITHQFSERCCSDDFADSLITAVNPDHWRKDDTGTFTDSANYTGLVGECTNISVGYLDQHSSQESQYAPYLEWLLNKLSGLKTSQLAIVRKPGEVDADSWSFNYDSRWNRYDDYGTGKLPRETREFERLVEAILDHPDVAADLLDGCGYTADDILSAVYSPKKGRKL